VSADELIILGVGAAILGAALYRLRLGTFLAIAYPLGAMAMYIALRGTVMTAEQALTTTVFFTAYGLIASERLHKTTVALVGAVAMLLLGLVTQEEALHGRGEVGGVDWNTIFLLIGMMVIVNIMRQTGVFEWVAIKSAKLGRGEPVTIMILISVATALLSALLDNVTTVLLTVPASLLICRALNITPVPMIMCVILSSNIGGTATLIGDPPNIIIGSTAQISFLDFLNVNTPVVLVVFAVFLVTVKLFMPGRVHVTEEQRRNIEQFDETQAITDKRLLRRSLVVFGVTLAGFTLHSVLHLEMATVALTGAALMVLMYRPGPEEALREVEWPTIFFFIGLFVMVSALVKVGAVAIMGNALLAITAGNVVASTMLVLWFSAIGSAVIGNVPFTATMTALIHSMAAAMHPEAGVIEAAHAPDVYPLWWALSLGACLGGNLTLVGAAANLVGTGISARAKHPISFVRFMKYGVPITLQGLILSALYLWLRFLR